ncbi:hypothetical protein KKB55_18340 [Myxococcota bacterium]|nr:hypothetical protein [Myxococcota bacterium]MBU1899705.1 hypothetical protein [Myxococcota bacterium]
MMWTQFGHLFIGNLIIGLLEGGLLVWLYKTPARRSLISMILANYFSMWVGAMAINNVDLSPLEIPTLRLVVWGLLPAFFFITVLLESPFVAVAFDAKGWARITGAALLTHVISYGLLILWYAPTHQTNLIDQEIVPAAALLKDTRADIYFLSAERKQILKLSAPLTRVEVAYTFETGEKGVGLYFEGGALWSALENEEAPRRVLTLEGQRCTPQGARDEPRGLSQDLGAAKFVVNTGTWAAEGLNLFDRPWQPDAASPRKLLAHYAFDTVFARWGIYPRVTLLPSGLILFSARDRVLVLDHAQARLAEIERGFSPAACVAAP